MKRETKVLLVLSWFLWVIVGIMISMGAMNAVGIWPEEWRF